MRVRAMATAVMLLLVQPDCYGFGPLFIGAVLRHLLNSRRCRRWRRGWRTGRQSVSPRRA